MKMFYFKKPRHFISPTISFLFALILSLPTVANAGEQFKIPTRANVETKVFWHATEGATATLLIFPGGGGGYGKVEDGWPTSQNFLVRSSQLFAKQRFNLAIFGRPTDSEELGYEDRIAEKHMQDIKATLEWIKQKNNLPIWVVGTSRGTISATAAMINIPDLIAGGVLTSSILNYKKVGAVPSQDLSKIKMPVLVYHHKQDACEQCRPHEAANIISGLRNAPIKKLIMVSGGANPSGGVCEALHWHGFIGMEPEAVAEISTWIKNPYP
ncbi:MAG: hypothetical protein RL020_1125 [Pseudomonadota bacterium]|jgi:hypothetical protein